MPFNCFNEKLLVGGQSDPQDGPVEFSDFDLLTRLDPEHQITSIQVCTDRAVSILKGAQVSYGKFNAAGEITEDVTLNPFGDVNQVRSLCTNFYISKDDYLSSIVYRYNEAGI